MGVATSRMNRMLCLLAFAPAIARAQDAKGPCPGSVGLDSALQGYVAKPDHKPHRQADGVEPTVDDGSFVLLTAGNEGHDMLNGGANKIVRLVGVIDTTGKFDSTSVTITESPYAVLSDAVCTAARQMRFDPATMKDGRKVPVVYKDWFTFRQQFDMSRMPRRS
jgi:hypothetical protein